MMYWYNPVTRQGEDREAPTTDAGAHRILSGREGAVAEYDGWRVTQGITAAMIYTGQTFQEVDAGREPPR